MLTRLHTLSIENNSFSSLPPLLAMLPSLNALLISGNPLKTTSRSLLTSGTANIIKWLRERGSDVPVWQQPQQSLENVTPPLLPKSLQDLQPHAVRSDSSVPVPSAFLQNLDAEIVELESRLQSSVHISQAQAFALKKQLQMKRAERIRSERTALAAASTYNLTEIYRK
jgi:hypothetical protein